MDRAPRGDEDRPILVIGYGNRLRRDDAVGPMAAEAIARRRIPGIFAIAAHQLLPELAEPLSASRLAVFIDARVADDDEAPQVVALGPTDSISPLGHMGDPARLLALSRHAFGSCPPAWLITIPIVDVSMGEGLSERASAGLAKVMRQLETILDQESGTRGN